MERSKQELIHAYAAGAIDGDGAIYLVKERQGTRPLYVPFVQLVKKFGSLIASFKNNFGGMVGSLKLKLPHHAPLHYWRLKGGNNCRRFLEEISKFLVYKKERAELLLEYIQKNEFVRGKVLTNDELKEREKYHVRMAFLNDGAYLREISMTEKSIHNTQDPAFWAYFAGIMDTDGSFSVKRQKGHSDTKNLRYIPCIQMSMASLDVINHIRQNCCYGTVCIAKNKSCSRGFHYAWSMASKLDSVKFIENILPYLMEKKDQALILLDFCKKSQTTLYCKAGIPKEELEFRESCYQKIMALNKGSCLL
jgi:hypothetical protein